MRRKSLIFSDIEAVRVLPDYEAIVSTAPGLVAAVNIAAAVGGMEMHVIIPPVFFTINPSGIVK